MIFKFVGSLFAENKIWEIRWDIILCIASLVHFSLRTGQNLQHFTGNDDISNSNEGKIREWEENPKINDAQSDILTTF